MTPAARLIPQMVITPACRGKQQQHPSLFLVVVVVVVVGGGGGGGAVVVSWYILPLSLAQNVQVYGFVVLVYVTRRQEQTGFSFIQSIYLFIIPRT